MSLAITNMMVRRANVDLICVHDSLENIDHRFIESVEQVE